MTPWGHIREEKVSVLKPSSDITHLLVLPSWQPTVYQGR